ncbi:MAG TPA: SpoIID/LytB domain-containing protein [Jatrophihabitans sp.]
MATGPARAVSPGTLYPVNADGAFVVDGHGNGHGHGLSQYGAQGAALAGLSTAQILAFYYPGTTLTTLAPVPTIRVRITGGYTQTCVQAKAGLTATGVSDALPSTGSLKIWLTQTSMTLGAYSSARCTGSPTKTWDEVGAINLDISSADGYVRLLRSDGTSADYNGSIGAAPSSAGEVTVNKVSLDLYAQGVAPREMPASWNLAAVQAQTIAARTYGEYELEHAAANDRYDICDSTNCQVYGGRARYDSSGKVVYTDFPAGAANNLGTVLTYKGSAAFTQYSASNGGWTVDGGQPYLVSKQDPYDNAASGDPYLNWTRTVAAKTVASSFGMKSVTSIEITGRDGNGDFGGRVTSGYVNGLSSSGATVRVQATGYGLQSALGLPENWFSLDGDGAQSLPPTPTSPYDSYLKVVFKNLAGAKPTVAQLRDWAGQLSAGMTPPALTTYLANSQTARRHAAKQLYVTIIGKTPGGATVSDGAAYIKKNGYLGYETRLFASETYYKKVGRKPAKLVAAMFANPLLLGKLPPAKTKKAWVARMTLRPPHKTVIHALLVSRPVVTTQVKAAAKATFGTTLANADVASWSSSFTNAGYSTPLLKAAALAAPDVLQAYGVTAPTTAG